MHVRFQLAFSVQVQPSLRGKLSGLYLVSKSARRMVGYHVRVVYLAVGPKYPTFVDYRFILNITVVLMALVTAVAWQTLKVESMTDDANGPASAPATPVGNIGIDSSGTQSQSQKYFGIGDGSATVVIEDRTADLV